MENYQKDKWFKDFNFVFLIIDIGIFNEYWVMLVNEYIFCVEIMCLDFLSNLRKVQNIMNLKLFVFRVLGCRIGKIIVDFYNCYFLINWIIYYFVSFND